VQAYLDPEANLDGVRDLLARRSGAGNAAALPCLAARLALRRSGTALVATHGTFTTDGSVDLRDHLGAVIPPELLCTWRLPPVTILTGCRTGTSNAGAPLHLAEAALVAGANHVIAVTHRTTDEIMDVVLAAVLRRLGASTAASGSQAGSLSPAQAVQSALQQVHRAYPIPATDPTPWSVVHVGPPACADGGTPF
jgi:hypothetical protein